MSGRAVTIRAPGRVNLMGDHTDYNDGLVLPVAIDRECRVTAASRSDGLVVARSREVSGEVSVAADGSDDASAVQPPWGRLLAGVVAALVDRGHLIIGADLAVSSSVPVGSGLSSSASFAVAVASALAAASGVDLARRDLALVAQEAEQRATGVPCGVMDQLASVEGVADHALLIDCRTLGVLPIALPPDIAILVVHSGEPRSLTSTPYADRRAHCERVAADLGIPSLRDATYDQVAADPIARHVVTENARVTAAALALAAHDLPALGDAIAASHASLRDDFDCSTPALDDLVAVMHGAGAIGARLTGAGWGGCAVALVERDDVESVVNAVGDLTHWVCAAVDGASAVTA